MDIHYLELLKAQERDEDVYLLLVRYVVLCDLFPDPALSFLSNFSIFRLVVALENSVLGEREPFGFVAFVQWLIVALENSRLRRIDWRKFKLTSGLLI